VSDAFIGYSFGFVEPNATVGVYLHGFDPNSFACLDVRAQASYARPGAFQPAITVDTTNVAEHVDGTLAHIVRVTNMSISNGAPPIPVVNVAVFYQVLS
jgi:hypothetical protein